MLSQVNTPAGFTDRKWASLAGRLRQKIPEISREPDPAKAIALFEQVNGEYLQEIIWCLEMLAQELAPKVDSNEKNALQTMLGEAVAGLKGARTSLESGDGNTAMASYNAASGKIKNVKNKLAGTGGSQLGALRATPFPAAIVGFFAPMSRPLVINEAHAVADRETRQPSPGEKLTETIRRYDLLLNVGLLNIATVLALKLLWADNPTWGGAGDFAVAFLWGLGLQQVGGSRL